MTAFLTTLLKVAIMLILITVGWVLSKINMITDKGSKEITSLLVYIVSPCLTVSSFMSADTEAVTAKSLLLAFVGAVIAMGLAIVLSFFFYGKSPDEEKRVIRFAIVFSNCGFIGIPLAQSIIGSHAVVYCTMFIAVYNVLVWTYGYIMMSPGNLSFLSTVKLGIINPGTVGLVAGLLVFCLKINLPDVIASPIDYFGALNTPLAMIVVGNNISKVKFKEIFTDKKIYVISFVRLILAPLIALPFLLMLHLDHDVFLTVVLQASAPVGANVVIFAVMFGRDSKLGSKLVAASTILSLITIPILTTVSESLLATFA